MAAEPGRNEVVEQQNFLERWPPFGPLAEPTVSDPARMHAWRQHRIAAAAGAEFAVADARFCFPLPAGYGDLQAAPLLCAGLIGFRALRLAGGAGRLGLYGFGSAAHIVAQVARSQGREVFAFTRPGDAPSQELARSLGVGWAGSTAERPPAELDAAILFAPAGELVPLALGAVRKGGTVVCAAST